jgi:hypothetical protein
LSTLEKERIIKKKLQGFFTLFLYKGKEGEERGEVSFTNIATSFNLSLVLFSYTPATRAVV